jgi:hypothetical protein
VLAHGGNVKGFDYRGGMIDDDERLLYDSRVSQAGTSTALESLGYPDSDVKQQRIE